MASILQKFSSHSKQALKNAWLIAIQWGHKTVNPEHLLYSLALQKGSIGSEILIKTKINSEEIKKSLLEKNPINLNGREKPLLSPDCKKIIEKAVLKASLKKHKYVGTEHLLLAVLEIDNSKINDLLKKQGIDLKDLKKQIEMVFKSTSKFPDLTEALEFFKEKGEFLSPTSSLPKTKTSFLDFFATNLTEPRIQKEIDPVIGRGEEIQRLIQILCRRTKNNPVLLGDPGVGKTAIVEGLAKKIIQGGVPDILIDKKIYTLDLGLVVAGTSFRGEFENRLKQIISEIKHNSNIILFIDELHNIIGAGSATGSMDAANILKPALARGEIRCIGATTLEEYKKHIESDPALERRFQPILISQPTIEKTIEILKGIKENYEKYHQITITDDAIQAATYLSDRYLQDKFLPDKAIDLVDEAASAAKIKQISNGTLKKMKKIEQEIIHIQELKQKVVITENFNQAIAYREKELELLSQLHQLREKEFTKNKKSLGQISKKEICQVISKITGIPLQDLEISEKARLLNLEKLIAKKIIGQPEVIKTVAEFIRRSRTGIADGQRPIGSFIFLGPSGVGKTELAKVLAETVFRSKDSLVRIDMSEFAEGFNISKLIGAPAGYVGYKETTKLTDTVKRKPYCVVLFDEIEKAHPEVFNLLLQVLEDGHLTDATGKKINFKNTIIIMTSNLSSEIFNQKAALGFQAKTEKEKQDALDSFKEAKEEILKNLKKHFRPEFLNRLDKIVVFKPLDLSSITKIVYLQIKDLNQRLKDQAIQIEINNKVAKFIAKKSYSPDQGARAVRKNIQELIENPIAEKILRNELKDRKIVRITASKEKIIFD